MLRKDLVVLTLVASVAIFGLWGCAAPEKEEPYWAFFEVSWDLIVSMETMGRQNEARHYESGLHSGLMKAEEAREIWVSSASSYSELRRLEEDADFLGGKLLQKRRYPPADPEELAQLLQRAFEAPEDVDLAFSASGGGALRNIEATEGSCRRARDYGACMDAAFLLEKAAWGAEDAEAGRIALAWFDVIAPGQHVSDFLREVDERLVTTTPSGIRE